MKSYNIALLSFVVMVGSYFCEAQSSALQFVPANPCRVADTRNAIGPFGGPAIASGSSRDFYIPQSTCNIPSNAFAYSLNVTAVPVGDLGYLTVSPSGGSLPLVSTLNSYDGSVKANAAIVPAGVNGGVNVFVTDTSHVILDINGYFVASSAEEFFAVTPCRVFDSRNLDGPLGGPTLAGEQTRHIPVLSSNCGIPGSAQAYSLNFTVIPKGPLGYLTTWPTGLSQPLVSTMNSYNGKVTANAAIVPAGSSGSIDVYVSDEADVVIDVDGYFAPPSSGGLSLYTLKPCRLLDTRNAAGPFAGELTIPFVTQCGLPNEAQAFVVNATVLPSSSLGYLSLWPDGDNRPEVSTLNSYDGAVTSNMAVVPTTNGSIDAYGSNQTQLILDVFGFFATTGSVSTYNLSVGTIGSGAGSIVSSDGRINCPSTCSAAYYTGSSVTLTAAANAGSTFDGWSGGGCSGTGICTIPLDSATNITATFNAGAGDVNPEGVYIGSTSNNWTFETIILPNNKLYALYGQGDNNTLYIGGLVTGQGTFNDNNTFSATIADYYSTTVNAGSITGSFVPGSSITGTLAELGVSETFNGTAIPSSRFNYNTPAVLSYITGNWTGTIQDGSTASISLQPNGNFTGSD